MDPGDPRGAAIDALVEREPVLLTQVLATIRGTYPTYESVSDEVISSSFHQNIEMCIRAVVDGPTPQGHKLRAYAQIARKRFEQGVPVEDLIRSYKHSIGLIADALTELFDAHGVSPFESLHAYRQIWMVSDVYSAVLVEVYRQHQLQLDTRNHAIKNDFIDRLRSGDFDDGILATAQTRFALRTDLDYRGFVAAMVGHSGHDIYSLLAMLEPQIFGHRGVCAIRGDVIVGICREVFDTGDGVSVSYGRPRPLSGIAESLEVARRVASTSTALSAGNHHLEEVGWRVAVDPESPVVDLFDARFRQPLDSAKVDAASTLCSVEEYLRQNRSYKNAARTLNCHPNTLRYRIARFAEITGCSVDDMETAVSLQWYFELRARDRNSTEE
ncbi:MULTISPECIES: PucR family transcriptional regulator [unclassified Dietzia]|uniref:PucR family transcriptional regulator n=1 Tax=unclassified Dietzia TaxID=2617939 RepID=UPI0015FA31B5|nr:MULTISPECIES: helix-turn-helix domain-containing protein [unclassified Dietzia]MBB1025397.1 PucR family transcriptional regulator [Dietzia sp. DQ12-76]MBB1026792.1 PucR family transcriptional regulator [Dietzia sp. DQ11-38-2]